MTAEEMFNELGYSLYYSRDKLIYGSGDYYIAFDLKDKLIEPYHDDYDTLVWKFIHILMSFLLMN